MDGRGSLVGELVVVMDVLGPSLGDRQARVEGGCLGAFDRKRPCHLFLPSSRQSRGPHEFDERASEV